jgi:SAM-dependent methyltransferase
MFRGCAVLDLCCGDGTYSRLFFSDIAAKIDAVDNDPVALGYARRYNTAPAISYHQIDIVSQPLPVTRYDIVVWNAAICYFDRPQIGTILGKIVRAGRPGMRLCGMLPRGTGYVDHKTEFADARSVEALLKEYFDAVTVREIDEISAVTFYFSASEPRLETA